MIALDPQTHHAFVTNGGANSVSVLDTWSGAVLRTVPVVARPQDVAIATRTSRAFVVNAIVDLSVLDTRSGAVLHTLHLGRDGGLEAALVVAEAARRVVVASTSPGGGVLSVLDAQTGAVLHRVHLGASQTFCSTTIGLGVRDMERSKRFYTDGLGWQVQQDYGLAVFFVPHGGSLVGFYGRDGLAADVGVSPDGSGFSGLVLNYVVRSEARVDELMAEAAKAGATLLKPAERQPWGGYGGSFADPDGYIWKIGYSAQGQDQPYAE